MNKIIQISVIFVLLVVLVIMLSGQKKLRHEVLRLEHELAISTKYIQHLTEQLSSKNTNEEPGKDDKMKEILQEYLREKNPPAQDVESSSQNFPDLVPIKDEYAVSQYFSEEHPALDFAAAEGTEVIAAASGEVLSVYQDKYFGNVMIIDHLNEYATLYAHLATAIQPSKTAVKKGETIGLVGNTGFSSAPHLHFEIMKNGVNLDPKEILNLKENDK